MKDPLKTFDPAISEDSRSVISLLELVDGQLRYVSQIGLITSQCGLDHVRANLTARQAKVLGLLTSGTSGQPGTTLLTSKSLQSSLGNKLIKRLGTGGSRLYKLTWKRSTTQLGVQSFQLRASVPRTQDTGYGSWPTPQVMDGSGKGRAGRLKQDRQRDPTKRGSYRIDLKDAAMLAGWSTPTVADARRGTKPPRKHDTGIPLSQQIGQMDIGQMPIGYRVQMESGGQLNPAFSLWLQGYKKEWLYCGVSAIQSFRKLVRSSSKRISK